MEKKALDKEHVLKERSVKKVLFQGGCHCGNVQITLEKLPETLTSCNCSVCSRYAALWGYYREAQVSIIEGELGASRYCWGDKYIEFHHCNNCKCITHYISTGKAKVDKVGINFRMFEPNLIKPIKIRHFDGAESWTFIDEE